MAAVMVLCGTCRASLFRPHYDHIVGMIARYSVRHRKGTASPALFHRSLMGRAEEVVLCEEHN